MKQVYPFVYFTEEQISPERLSKLKEYLGVIRKAASLWTSNILIDTSEVLPAELQTPSTVLHFSSVPLSQDFRLEPYSFPTLFGHELSPGKHFIYRLNERKGNQRLIYAPEGEAVAFVAEKNIYLLFDFLNASSIETREALFIILFLAMPRAIGAKKKPDAFFSLYNISSKQEEKTITGTERSIKSFIRKFQFLDKRVAEEMAAIERVVPFLNRERMALQDEILKMENLKNNQLEKLRSNSKVFDEEFEKITKMEGVRRLRVANNRFEILTDLILTAKQQNIGAFEIEIDPRAEYHGELRFTQKRYGGSFKHAHVSDVTQICFGSMGKENLNDIVDKLMSDGDVVNLAHLLLTFLRHESHTLENRPQMGSRVQTNFFPRENRQAEPYPPRLRASDKRAFIGLRKKNRS